MPHFEGLTPATMYLVLNYGVLPFWALLIVLPHARLTEVLVHSALMPLVLGVTYAWLLANAIAGPTALPEGASFATLDGLVKTFSSETVLVAGWAHYLVFDLFIGAWQARDAQRVGLHHLALAPCLVITLLVGPIGLLLYLMVRGISGKGGFSLFEG
ncbi:MAG: ABA4-like family protein [Micropepsaceae bacterium]